ncbi:MAG: 1-acyl-sn-glycerol-3-phosphate acyltransferase [Bacteroidales bacterium]|nr:1-acyl-sn-glycerol-3-phosphate acyltransferase [Bacteroidales bacterium]
MQNIEKTNFLYRLLYRTASLYFHLFYRKVTVLGRENIPENVPLIFAANHQNALMDALAILFAARRPVVFLARADIFKNPRIARLLYFLKILPVFRIRDGIESMGNNNLIFNKTVKVLQSGLPIGILPEGTHTHIKRLQTLKKGICRIAFMAAESTDYALDINIVPVGLDYTSYQNAGTHLIVNFGKPLSVAAYYGQYRDNPQKAITLLRDDLAQRIRAVMIHVEDELHHDLLQSLNAMTLRTWLQSHSLKDTRVNRFTSSMEVLQHLENGLKTNALDPETMAAGLMAYQELLRKYRIRDDQVETESKTLPLLLSWVAWILLLPVQVAGMILNWLPYKVPVLISAKIKDPQFISSVNYGLSLFVFLFWYLILLINALLLPFSLAVTLPLIVASPFAGLLTFYNYLFFKKLLAKSRFYMMKRINPEQALKLKAMRTSLADRIETALNIRGK